MGALKDWMRAANPSAQERLASMAGTSRAYLYHLVNPSKSHSRSLSAEKAGKLEDAARSLMLEDPTLPPLRRPDLCRACSVCPYARQVLGEARLAEQINDLDNPPENE